MNFSHLKISNNGSVSTVTINRPDKLNALNMEVIDQLSQCMTQLDKDPSVRCIILTGEGQKAFVAGADISEFYKFSKEKGYKLSFDGQTKLFDFIENYSKPVIAAVNGYALGGGLELAMACHIRIASENTLLLQMVLCM